MEIEFFNSFDDMMTRLQEAMKAADARVTPWQASITSGNYFLQQTEYGFHIYGVVLKEDTQREPHLQHYRLCKCYSVACPEGGCQQRALACLQLAVDDFESEPIGSHVPLVCDAQGVPPLVREAELERVIDPLAQNRRYSFFLTFSVLKTHK